MSPDVNSLASSRSPSNSTSPILSHQRRVSYSNVATPGDTILTNPPSPRSPQLSSLHAAAAINAGLQRSPSSNTASLSQARRRSSLAANMNNPATPGPGEMQPPSAGHAIGSPPTSRSPMNYADPNHHRAPSLGQIHQELENEQEAQVNRLLHMIRVQQDQLNTLQAQQQSSEAANLSSAIDEAPSPQREILPPQPLRSLSSSSVHQPPRSPVQRPSMSRHSSRGIPALNSNASSPSLRPISSNIGHDEWSMGGTRDDSAFYQAETQTLQRENQMLKHRIRELERQISGMNLQPPQGPSNGGA